jgi:GntR family transcriptional regulator
VLNPEAPAPLYRQLAADLTLRIQSGEFRRGERLPSEPKLAALHHIGRPTVRQATDLLVRKGLVERRRGSGTFVRTREPQVDLFAAGGTIAAFKKGGFVLKTRLLRPVALRNVSEGANPLHGKAVFSLVRLGTIETKPVLLELIDLAAEVFPGLDQVPLDGQSLSQLVERVYHRSPSGSRQEFTLATLERPWARCLGVTAKTPLLVVRRTLDFPGAAAACYGSMFCRPDRIQFVQTLPLQP